MFKYSITTYQRIVSRVVYHFLKEGGIEAEEITSFKIVPDSTINRYKVKVAYKDYCGEANIRMRVQVIPVSDSLENLFIDVISTLGDQTMEMYSIEKNDVIDTNTGEVVYHI